MTSPPVEYADYGRLSGEATRSLARFLGVTEDRAAAALADPDTYAAELRLMRPVTGMEARRLVERRYPACPRQ